MLAFHSALWSRWALIAFTHVTAIAVLFKTTFAVHKTHDRRAGTLTEFIAFSISLKPMFTLHSTPWHRRPIRTLTYIAAVLSVLLKPKLTLHVAIRWAPAFADIISIGVSLETKSAVFGTLGLGLNLSLFTLTQIAAILRVLLKPKLTLQVAIRWAPALANIIPIIIPLETIPAVFSACGLRWFFTFTHFTVIGISFKAMFTMHEADRRTGTFA